MPPPLGAAIGLAVEPLCKVDQVGNLFGEEGNAARRVFFSQVIPTTSRTPQQLVVELDENEGLVSGVLEGHCVA